MNERLAVACVQMTSGDDPAANLSTIERWVIEAAHQGARLVTLPENCLLMTAPEAFAATPAWNTETHPGILACRELARKLGIHLLLGSVAVTGASDGRRFNRSLLIDPHGVILATYDKIHLFDVTLPGGEAHRESARFAPGDRTVTAKVEDVTLGLSVCYDLRFPHLYRALARAGAQVLTVPSAFTYVTGVAHWHVLLRARAIETGSFVLAPAQVGTHPGNRRTYGHALIVNPWGEVLADAGGEAGGFVSATLDMREVARIRATLPSLALEALYV